MTFAEIITNIRINLADEDAIKHSVDEVRDSVQDAYDDIVFQTACIVKKTTLSWLAQTPYLDFIADFSVADWMATTAIFDNNSRSFLDDSLSLRDLNVKRDRWELDFGTPTNWMPSDPKRTVIWPSPSAAVGTFELYYWAAAPTIDFDDTESSPLIVTDMQELVELYATADLLDSIEHFTDSKNYWASYFKGVNDYFLRSKDLAKSDILRILAR